MRIRLIFILTVFLLHACGVPQSPAQFDKTPEAQYLKATVDRLVARDFMSIESQMDERVHQADARQALERLASVVPAGPPLKLDPVAWNFFKSTSSANGGVNSRSANVAIEYAFPSSKWMVASATLSGEPGNFRILAFNVEPLSAPLSELNAFTFRGKGIFHYVFLVLTVAALGVSVFAFVRCLRTAGLKRKWLWALFTLVGVVAVSLNWSNGAVSIDALRFNFFSAGFARAGWVGPWSLTFCIPIGAIIFLWKHRKPIAALSTDG